MNIYHFHYSIPETIPGGRRLDQFLADEADLCRRSQLKQRVRDLRCNGKPAKLSTRVLPGDIVEGSLEAVGLPKAIPQPVDFPLIHEGRSFLVIDKPQGLVVHPGAGNPDGTLVNGLLWRYRDDPFFQALRNIPEGASGEEISDESDQEADQESDQEGDLRPGIVHRLDKDTSGVMIVAKTLETHQYLVDQFMAGSVKKLYLAITRGAIRQNQGIIDSPLGRDPNHRRRFAVTPGAGKPAHTAFQVLRRFPQHTLVLLKPSTGRTHQLRVHLASLGNPILGDPLYARPDRQLPQATLMLHARLLELSPEPEGGVTPYIAPVPERFREVLRILSGKGPSRG
ncbi:23S rRNA pseudouridine1911/1915/1917 synthase [Alkalispirochaeta americana]|uniref:Pseudouridine synthase n=1 Tax=Alkalispirochaeta americana TaxID=159291 RepID=A0A1N6P1Z7_9SPIO|nr:RluA family pseudouridine synthase [Alkalispirochaeta americana]SIP98287.1 23S rRNA pseudouridine1911/1915/1917 synthase [Alkalispirochaeta americana]